MPKQSSWLLKNLMDPSAEKAESLMRSRSADLHQGQGRTKPHNRPDIWQHSNPFWKKFLVAREYGSI
jgi:hypothetical protein